jgi:pimeloyl-ACP methyl ester carboxylesterase
VGNATAQNALALLRAKVIADYGLPANTPTMLIGASMGGMASMSAVARQTLPAGVLKGVFLIDAAFSLFDMYKTSYYSEIDTAYGVVFATLSGAVAAGATALPGTGSYAAGAQLVVGGGTAGAEKVTVAPGGSTGTSIPITTALANAHASGERVSDFATKTDGYDPLVAANANFTGLPVRYTASNADTLVPIDPNTLAMQARLAGVASGKEVVMHLMGHLAEGATNPADFVKLLKTGGVV